MNGNTSRDGRNYIRSNFCSRRLRQNTHLCSCEYRLRPFEAMALTNRSPFNIHPRFASRNAGRHVCWSAGCGRPLDVLGFYDSDVGAHCGLCETYDERARLLCKEAVRYILLASSRSTSPLLTLVRGGFIDRQLAGMLVGTLSTTIEKYKVRLLRANARLLLCGKKNGFKPLFQRKLDRVWRLPEHIDQTSEDMVERILGFVWPLDHPTWREMRL